MCFTLSHLQIIINSNRIKKYNNKHWFRKYIHTTNKTNTLEPFHCASLKWDDTDCGNTVCPVIPNNNLPKKIQTTLGAFPWASHGWDDNDCEHFGAFHLVPPWSGTTLILGYIYCNSTNILGPFPCASLEGDDTDCGNIYCNFKEDKTNTLGPFPRVSLKCVGTDCQNMSFPTTNQQIKQHCIQNKNTENKKIVLLDIALS